MREFFYGWRRKVGCGLLVMACLGVGAWIRSRFVTDTFEIRPNNTSVFSAEFDVQAIKFECRWDEIHAPPVLPLSYRVFEWKSNRITRVVREEILLPALDRGRYFSQTATIEDGGYMSESSSGELFALTVPYWLSVLLPTLLSACLILWKPRQSDRPKTKTPAGD